MVTAVECLLDQRGENIWLVLLRNQEEAIAFANELGDLWTGLRVGSNKVLEFFEEVLPGFLEELEESGEGAFLLDGVIIAHKLILLRGELIEMHLLLRGSCCWFSG